MKKLQIRQTDDVLWHQTSGGGPELPVLKGARRADVAVIGGGLLGLGTALELRQQGVDVAVLEASVAAAGASGRNAGFVVPNLAKSDPTDLKRQLGPEAGMRLARLVSSGGEKLFGRTRDLGIDCDAVESGWIQPAHSAEAVAVARRRCEDWQALGRPVEWLEADDVERLLGCPGYPGGWIDRSGGTIHPVKYVNGLAEAVIQAGGAVFGESPVTAIERTGGTWRLSTPVGTLEADTVVVCTNAMVGALHPVLAKSFVPLTVFQMATQPLDAETAARLLPGRQAMSDTRADLFTFRFDPDNRLITGGMAILPWGAEARLAAFMCARLKDMLKLPALPQTDFIWSGEAAVTRNYLPAIHELGPGLWAGFGCNGRGLAMTTVLTGELAALAIEGPGADTAVPVTPLKPLPLHGLIKHAPRIWLIKARMAG